MLVKYNDDWADEMYINGFRLFTHEEWNNYKKSIPDREFDFNIGTNENITYYNADRLLSRFKVFGVTEDQVKFLLSVFGRTVANCQDWDGEQYNRIEKFTVVDFGFSTSFDNYEYEEDD